MKNMKKISRIALMIFAVAAIFSSCKKDDPVLPTASFTYAPENIVQSEEIQFTSTSTDADSYLWDFGNGALTSTDANPIIIFESTGDVVVKLTVTNGDGSKTAEQTITVHAKAVAIYTYAPTSCVQFEEVQFTNSSTDATSYTWDFGDGNTSTEENPAHTFLTSGDFVVKLTATNDYISNEVEQTITVTARDNHYMLDAVKIVITDNAPFFWYQSSMGGDPYLRCISVVTGQDNPDLIKLYPNKGLGDLAQTYTWDSANPVGTYNHGYTANYAGMAYDWTAIGKTGSGDLVIEKVDTDIYKIAGTMILSVGSYDWGTGVFTETSTKNLTIDYVGAITAL